MSRPVQPLRLPASEKLRFLAQTVLACCHLRPT